ncbi:hypothetical protein BST45_15380 [Mycobacterium shinjukuense]|nr:hypothetical protein BST45_15380 [Mycobacterium shinjukuense]
MPGAAVAAWAAAEADAATETAVGAVGRAVAAIPGRCRVDAGGTRRAGPAVPAGPAGAEQPGVAADTTVAAITTEHGGGPAGAAISAVAGQ